MAGSRNAARVSLPLYESDYHQWIADQVAALRAGDPANLDAENIAEELKDLGKGVRRELQSRLELILSHLLKWTFQPSKRTPSWENTIFEQRQRVSDLLLKNPSLRSHLDELTTEAYRYARSAAGNDMGLAPREWRRFFPSRCQWSRDEILSTSFLPQPRVT